MNSVTDATGLGWVRSALKSAGTAFVEGVFEVDQIKRFSDALSRADKREREAYGEAFLKDIGQLGYVSDFLGIGPEAADLLNTPRLHQLLDEVFGEEVRLFAAQGIILGPGEGRHVFPRCWHVDMFRIAQDIVDPSTIFAVNFLVLVEDITHENGATAVLPGTHRTEGLEGRDETYMSDRAIEATGSAGSICLIEGGTWHAAGFNNSERPRPVLKLMFARRWIRPQIDYCAQHADVLARLTPVARRLLNASG
jgi:hypothetical protein